MEEYDIYKDISERTNGDIYLGVVGPVRSGKSTFITNFMNKLVLPKADSSHALERMRDELPQSAEGKTIMTTQPKFVPAEAVKVKLADNIEISVRLVDCVGYLIDGVNGHMEGGKERMVKTPWSEQSIPFEKAAEMGTEKVIREHSTIGIVMTSDGSIATEIARTSYIKAEERTVNELKKLGKPFVVILNSTVPSSKETQKLAAGLNAKYETPVIAMDVKNLTEKDVIDMFERILYEFPLRNIEIKTAKWLRAMQIENPIITELMTRSIEKAEGMVKMSDCITCENFFTESEYFDNVSIQSVQLGQGKVVLNVDIKPNLFFQALSDESDIEIKDEFDLMASLNGLVKAKKKFDKMSKALEDAETLGYGVVAPSLDEMLLDEPKIVRQGSRFGVKLKASAPSLHIMRVDIESEISPIVGTEQQSEDLVKYLLSEFENNPQGIWQTNMFGKSLHNLVNEGINNKLTAMPVETQKKMRRTLSRIVNEGKGGIICILL